MSRDTVTAAVVEAAGVLMASAGLAMLLGLWALPTLLGVYLTATVWIARS